MRIRKIHDKDIVKAAELMCRCGLSIDERHYAKGFSTFSTKEIIRLSL